MVGWRLILTGWSLIKLNKWPGCRDVRGQAERRYDVRCYADAVAAVQNADVSGGASPFRVGCVSRRLAAAEPRPERRWSSGAGIAGACCLRHVDASAAQLSEEPRLCRQRLASGPQPRSAPRCAERDGRS